MNNKLIVISSLLVVVLLVAGIFLLSKPQKTDPKLDTFAQCIASTKLTMYGAYWCSHCQAQKKLFGPSFKYIPYVECTQQTALCLEKKIEGYPTWIDAAGNRYDGEQTLEKLSEITQCKLQ